ncbi:hypothetical protein HCN44_002454 [Aphidius gifuensis]|uniref:Odorant receptor n=1 Tax=Aphidius gifuensis TaxID=684658 RepID=A0A834Y063_APHGI|nr:odorant receptor 43a-like [Aphidius gifuensis]KAF7996808.1 hypothetical protein HCN44_002454 [Aphidius gifuensis]
MKVTPEIAVKFTKITNCFMLIWQPKNKYKKYLFEFLWWFCVIDAFFVLLTLIGAIIKYSSDTLIAMKTAIFMSGVVNFLIKISITKINRQYNHEISMKLDFYLKTANKNQRIILQNYVDKSWFFHAYMTWSYYIASILFLIGPLFLPQKLPNDAVYPFSTEPLLTFTIIYAQDILVGFQISAGLVLDCQAALYLWFSGALFEILALEINNIKNYKQLKDYVKKHHDLILFTEKIIKTVSGIAFTTISMTIIGIVLGSIILASNQPATVKLQFTVLVLSASINILVCARAADNLIVTSSDVMVNSLYNFPWYKLSTDAKKIIQIMMQRTQKPITISLSGFVGSLSYQYYASFVSTAVSYFTTLRIMLEL